jgi:hypothetical protein
MDTEGVGTRGTRRQGCQQCQGRGKGGIIAIGQPLSPGDHGRTTRGNGNPAKVTGLRRFLQAGIAVRSGTVATIALQQGSAACPLAGPLAEARIPARAPPWQDPILVLLHGFVLDPMMLFIISAGSWVLRVLLRSIGQLGPLLGSFIAVFAPSHIALTLFALSLRLSRFLQGPADWFHRGP